MLFSIIIYIILFLLLYLSIIKETKQIGERAKQHGLGRGNKDESVETLLDRISWVSGYKDRMNTVTRSYLVAMALGVIIPIVVSGELTPQGFFLTTIISFFILFYSDGFFFFHSDIFPMYYTQKNVDYIRKKLKLKEKLKKEEVKLEQQKEKCSFDHIIAYYDE